MRYDTGRVNALVLAGGINRIELFPGYTPGYKAVLPFRENRCFNTRSMPCAARPGWNASVS